MNCFRTQKATCLAIACKCLYDFQPLSLSHLSCGINHVISSYEKKYNSMRPLY